MKTVPSRLCPPTNAQPVRAGKCNLSGVHLAGVARVPLIDNAVVIDFNADAVIGPRLQAVCRRQPTGNR